MAMKEKHLVISRCRLCRRKFDKVADFKNIKETYLRTSKKTIKDVLTHLSKCIKTEVILTDISYICGPCYEKLAEYDEIMLQLLTHQKELASLLEISTKAFDQESKEEEHIDSIDLVDSDDSYVYSQEEDVDVSVNPQKSDNKCSICDQILPNPSSLKTHLNAHNRAKKCHICGVTRRDEEYLELHMNIHEGKSENECRYCDKQYTRRSHVIRHMHLHWDKKKFQCEKCGLQFSQSQQLYNHKLHHEAEENPLVCAQCGQTFKSSKTYKHHLVTHREDRPMYPCELCGKQFSEKYTLKVHLKTHTDPAKDQPEVKKKKRTQSESACIICNSIQSSKEALVEHMTRVHDVIMPLCS